ncbi:MULTISPECIES: hypothetical protein [unclassified Nocardioides]|uniref:hypothetical protein n=1 Tax=unclassified Nocardioides TaxID=2615069 RepID=UPI000AD17D9B|nr:MULTISPECIES: hypothetical protein [unclassified Nocardioides]
MRAQNFLGRTLPALAVATGITLVASISPSVAAPPVRPGAVTGLVAGAITKPAAAYVVPATWNQASRATTYRVQLVDAAGVVLDSETVTDEAWTAFTTARPGTSVRVRVTPYAGTRRGKLVQSGAKVLADLTAPTGAFDVSVDADGYTTTVTQAALSDDVTAADSITRTVTWGDSTEQEWSTGTSLVHVYPTTEARYVPRVRLTDLAGNTRELTLDAVVVNDHAAPTGAFTLSPATAWAKLTKVQLTQDALVDNWTPGNLIERRVDWGDGTPLVLWTTGTVLAHVYRTAGPFTPSVTLTDEAQNSVPVEVGAVTVKADTARPVVRLTLPRAPRTSVRKWTTLRGVARDSGTGVRQVRVRAVEKRGAAWYAFRPATGTWVKAGTTKSAALRKSGIRVVVPTATGTWTARLPRLAKGQLVYNVIAQDKVGNLSTVVWRAQSLTRR